MKKRVAFVIIFVISTLSVFGQRYRDIFPQIDAADDEKAFELLFTYLQSDLDHPNTNLRIADIYIKRYKAIDVLEEYEKALALAEEAKWRLLKSKIVVTEKEVNKNAEYYFGFFEEGRAPTYSGIMEFINKESAAVDEFILKAPPIYESFVHSVEKYDEAVKNFSVIVGSHGSLKELYLLYDADLIQKLNDLRISYDSTKTYFNNYLDLRNEYKINAVEQIYTEEAIEVYRLDGLVTQINFLQPKIILWNYTAWVDSVTKVVESTIKDLREDLIRNDHKLKEAVVEVIKSPNPESFITVRAEKSLIFNLKKYDYKNAIVPLLLYEEYKQQLIKEQKRMIYFDTAAISLDRKLAYHSNMMYAIKHGDSIISEFETKFDPDQLKRHQDFIDNSYGSTGDLKKYMAVQKKDNQKFLLKEANSIRAGIESSTKMILAREDIKFKRSIIPTYIVDQPLAELPIGQIATRYIFTSADDGIYLAGLQITDAKRKNQEVAVAKLSADLKPLWVRTLDLEIDSAGVDANHWLGDIKLTSQGFAIVIRSVAFDSSRVVNTLLHFTDAGEIKFAKRFDTELVPREINFIESANIFVVAFFAQQISMDFRNNERLSVLAINGLGEKLWQYDKNYTGDYRQMINTPKSIMLGGNYKVIENDAGETYTASSGTNAFVMSLTMKGMLQSLKCYVSAASYTINRIYKVNDKNINLIGNNGMQIIIDSNLERIYSSVILK